MQIKNVIFQSWKSISIVLCILYLSFAPPSSFKEIPTFEIKHLDKIVHFLMYAGLSLVLIYDFRKRKNTSNKSAIFVLICLLFPVFLGGMIEIFQELFFAPRTAEWADWFFDILGVFAAWMTSKFSFNSPKGHSH